MKIYQLTLLSLTVLMFTNCGGDEALRQKELELKEREIAIREKELGIEHSSEQDDFIHEASNSSGSHQYEQKPTEETLREDLFKREAASPKEYLSASYSYRVNLLANTIIEGEIYNAASIAGFKNVEMTVYFKSKTDVVLGKETFTVMEFVPANGSVSFRHKIAGWWDNVASSQYAIVSAESY